MKTLMKTNPRRMFLTSLLLAATMLCGAAQASAQSYRLQYYSSRTWYYSSHRAYARNYYYRPLRVRSYRRHYVYYFKARPRYAYFYSPRRWTRYYRVKGRVYHRTYKKGYYGRCDISTGKYQWLKDGYDQPGEEIADKEFGDMKPMGMIPERQDGPMETPPPPPPA